MDISDVRKIYQDRLDQETERRKKCIEDDVFKALEDVRYLLDVNLNNFVYLPVKQLKYTESQSHYFRISLVNKEIFFTEQIYNYKRRVINRLESEISYITKDFLQKNAPSLIDTPHCKIHATTDYDFIACKLYVDIFLCVDTSDMEGLKNIDLSKVHPYFKDCLQKAIYYQDPAPEEELSNVMEKINKYLDVELSFALKSLVQGAWYLSDNLDVVYIRLRNIPEIESEISHPTIKRTYSEMYLSEIRKRLQIMGGVYSKIKANTHGFIEFFEDENGFHRAEKIIELSLIV